VNLLDVNVLIALFRPDHVHHERARAWWQASQAVGEPFTVPDIVWVGFFRLVTSARLYSVPASFDEASQFFDAIVTQELHLGFFSDPWTMAELRKLGTASRIGSALVTDAYIAATAVTLGATVVTFDRDFRKLDGVRVLEPA
jgi:uncharacterized protein